MRNTSGGMMYYRKNIDHDFFSEWSDKMAYVLGFWAADGCAIKNKNSRIVSFNQSEKAVLYGIKKAMKSEHAVCASICRGNPLFSFLSK